MSATVTRHRAPSGNRDNDYHQPRPLQEVLEEHVDQVRAARRQALEQLAAHALPADAPGAWIRKAVAAELGEE